MRIIPKQIIEFNVEVDSDGNTLRYEDLIEFFNEYPDLALLEYVNKGNGSLEVIANTTHINRNFFNYLVNSGILIRGSAWANFFLVNDFDKLKTFMEELVEVYLDIKENYDMHKREFLIDNVLL